MTALVVAVTFLLTEAVGYLIHWLAHQPYMGALYRIHLIHHYVFYPPARFLTDQYRGGLRDSFVPFFIPGFVLLGLLGWWWLTLPMFIVALLTMSAVAFVNSWLHDSFHLREHWLKRFRWHRRLTLRHFRHHQRVQRNLGIYWFAIDRIRGKFTE